jgi:hypothetical protein
MIQASRIIAERLGWTGPEIASYLGYPDDVIYDPKGVLTPIMLYSLNRIIAAENLMESVREEKTA